jgi:hypothetical protein
MIPFRERRFIDLLSYFLADQCKLPLTNNDLSFPAVEAVFGCEIAVRVEFEK